MKDDNRFSKLNFEDFKKMADDDSLSQYEKIGFPDSYRKGKEDAIFEDILSKMGAPDLLKNGVALDIGPGCSSLPIMLKNLCKEFNCKLLLVDSEAMLSHLPDETFIEKHYGRFPYVKSITSNYEEKVNFILCYSVFHYIYEEDNIWSFLDESLSLLSEGGVFLIGDIPNISMRKRFFSSGNGIKYHKEFTNSNEIPKVEFNKIEKNKIDDSVILAILQRARSQGFDAYVVPQRNDLPMANRREDIVIKRP